jgi:hypothetical protein
LCVLRFTISVDLPLHAPRSGDLGGQSFATP